MEIKQSLADKVFPFWFYPLFGIASLASSAIGYFLLWGLYEVVVMLLLWLAGR